MVSRGRGPVFPSVPVTEVAVNPATDTHLAEVSAAVVAATAAHEITSNVVRNCHERDVVEGAVAQALNRHLPRIQKEISHEMQQIAVAQTKSGVESHLSQRHERHVQQLISLHDQHVQDIEQLVDQRLLSLEAKVDQRLDDRVQEEVRPQTAWSSEWSSGTPLPLTRPPTEPRPFSSLQQARFTAQDKHLWASSAFYSIAAVPNDDASTALSHCSLEHNLVDKVTAAQPDRTPLGISDMMVRDVVNTVVRDIVGVIESLIDRLLIEKKHDTIRTMVAEMLSADISATISTAHEQLKKKEMGHIIAEVSRLRVEVQDCQASWEQRFQITGELKNSQDELSATMNDRCRDLEARVTTVETDYIPRPELRAHVNETSVALIEATERIDGLAQQDDQMKAQIADLDDLVRNDYASKALLNDVQQELTNHQLQAKEEASRGLDDLRDYAAEDSHVQETHNLHADKLEELRQNLLTAQQHIEQLTVHFQNASHFNAETYATKHQVSQDVEKLAAERRKLEACLREEVGDLETRSTSKATFEATKRDNQRVLQETQELLGNTAAGLREATAGLQELKERCNEKLATREYAYDIAKHLAVQISMECDEKEEIARLRREFEEERERVRQIGRQQQHTRKELNDTIDEVHALQLREGELGRHCEQIESRLGTIDGREDDHWNQGQAILAKQQNAHSELESLHKTLREEFMSHTEHQRVESEQLRNHTMHRYLEQMDKALGLHRNLAQVEHGHKELSETVRNIKLPKVN